LAVAALAVVAVVAIVEIVVAAALKDITPAVARETSFLPNLFFSIKNTLPEK
jgi:hypothetical protein